MELTELVRVAALGTTAAVTLTAMRTALVLRWLELETCRDLRERMWGAPPFPLLPRGQEGS